MKYLKIRLAKNKSEYGEILRIRLNVFVKEQKVPSEIEVDEHENTSKHFIAFYRGKPVGCGRLRFIGGKAKLERIAVLKRYRNKGFGTRILKHMVNYAKRKNPKEIYIHAQYYLKDYYKKLGFKPTGKIFYEAGIKHIKMYLVDKL